MGQITAFDLDNFIKDYKTKIYFETGTGECVSLDYALRFNFEKFYSVDLDEDLYKKALLKFESDNRINLINDFSTKALEIYLPNLNPNENILFFLDAHFPGADFHKISYEESIRTYKEEAFPLEKELRIIKNLRNCEKDVFIIDDFVLYHPKDEYESIKLGHRWQYGWLQEEMNIETKSDFIFELFEKTHDFEIDYRHQGYLIIKPKK